MMKIDFNTTDLPEEEIARDPIELPKEKPWVPTTIPEEYFKQGEDGDVVVALENLSPPVLEKSLTTTNHYNIFLEKVRKEVSEGVSPEDAFKKHGIPYDPRVRKALLAAILLDQNSTYDFPADVKRLVLESQTFRMFVESTQTGDHKNAQRWAKLLGEDPALGRHKKEVEVIVRKDAILPFLTEVEVIK